MYARSTTLRGNPQRMDEGIAMVRDEILPVIAEMDGCRGLSMLAARSTGRVIVTSAWESHEAMRATADAVSPLRRRGAELLGASPEVREWEIAVLHREHAVPQDARASVTWTRGNPADAERNLQSFRDQVMPLLQELEGFCSVSLFIDRDEGRGVTATVFRDRLALDNAKPWIQAIREGALDRLSLELLDVAELEVAYAHLRVPETV